MPSRHTTEMKLSHMHGDVTELIAAAPRMDAALRWVSHGEPCTQSNCSGMSEGDYWIDSDDQPMPLCAECAAEAI